MARRGLACAVGAFLLAGLLPGSSSAAEPLEMAGGAPTELQSRPWHPPPYPPSDLILGAEFEPSTRRTLAKGSDIWPITWADDDHQYTAWGDGGGFGGSDRQGRVSLGVARVEGPWDEYRGINVWGGEGAEAPATFTGKGTGILCVGGVLWMWVAGPDSSTVPETRLAASRDRARTWRLADWKWTMHDGVFAGTFLNFGRDYAGARDDYVYTYFTRLDNVPDAPRNWIHEVPGRVDLARVPKDRLLDRSAYEWFAGLRPDGGATWTAQMASRREVFEDPNGIKLVSACRPPELGRYLLVYNPRDNRGNFGLFEAPEPWGPWKTVSYLHGCGLFMPPAENARVSVFHFAPKWWSGDGREFTLVFNTGDDAWNTVRGRLLSREAVRQVTTDAGLPGGCGMGWWTNAGGRYPFLPRDAVYGAGAGDQLLLVVPSLNLIMVRNGATLTDEPEAGDVLQEHRDPRARVLFAPLIAALTDKDPEEGGSATASGSATYPPSPVIADIVLDWSTHERHAQGSDNFQLTWASDGHQYGAWGDGGGFGGTNSDGRVGLGFARIEGDWNDYRGYNVWGGKDPENPAQFTGKSWGTISVGGVLYSWIVPDEPDTGGARDHYRYVELARSTDRAAHWTKADWRWLREDNLIVPTFLVYGRDNAGARDGYVYSYFIRPQNPDATQSGFGLEVHKPGALFLARVPENEIFSGRDAYQWYTGAEGSEPTWGALAAKQPVFENPEGTGWCVSASYHPGLARYLLATEHTASHAGVMALFDAPEPWGPWTTVKYWTPDDPFGRHRPGSRLPWADNVFFFSFAPKWLSADGREFTLVFTGGGKGKDNDSFNTVRGTFNLRRKAGTR